ncbi:MAG: serine/threonine-protein kinase [Verrucomicrobiota bacterium]
MTEKPTNCPRCGKELDPEFPESLCPSCLMAGAAAPTQDEDGKTTDPISNQKAVPDLEAVQKAFPQLEILELIGRGGMGAVFKARQPHLDRLIAVKILPTAPGQDAGFAQRFSREARVLARLNHPNIVTLHDFGESDDFFFLLMEYVDGVNLRQAMRTGRFSPEQALEVVPRICEALQFAHSEGILHRDIKPDNILLNSKSEVKIADFGIAKVIDQPDVTSDSEDHDPYRTLNPGLTAASSTLGTPQYMAPEQLNDPKAVDHRADIYSLGVVFYEMLTGELPTGRFSPPSEKSDSDQRLDAVVMQALEQEREQRQQSVDEVRSEVETIAATPNAGAPESVASESKAPSGRTSRVLKIAFALGGLVLLAIAGIFFALIAIQFLAYDRTASNPAANGKPEETTLSSALISNQEHSIYQAHQNGRLHYVCYHPGNMKASGSTHNSEGEWKKSEGILNLNNGDQIRFFLDSGSPNRLSLNGQTYFLNRGRFFVLRSRRSIEQLKAPSWRDPVESDQLEEFAEFLGPLQHARYRFSDEAIDLTEAPTLTFAWEGSGAIKDGPWWDPEGNPASEDQAARCAEVTGNLVTQPARIDGPLVLRAVIGSPGIGKHTAVALTFESERPDFPPKSWSIDMMKAGHRVARHPMKTRNDLPATLTAVLRLDAGPWTQPRYFRLLPDDFNASSEYTSPDGRDHLTVVQVTDKAATNQASLIYNLNQNHQDNRHYACVAVTTYGTLLHPSSISRSRNRSLPNLETRTLDFPVLTDEIDYFQFQFRPIREFRYTDIPVRQTLPEMPGT